MKKHTPTEQKLIIEGRDLLHELALARRPDRQLMCRARVAFFFDGLAKAKGDDSDTFFLESVVFSAILMLASEDCFEEAHALLDELGTMEDIDGTRIAARPEICIELSKLRKGLRLVQDGAPVPDDAAMWALAKRIFGTK